MMKLLLTGDICPTDLNTERFARKDVPALFGDTVHLFENNDFVIVNLECAVTEHDTGIEKYGPCLKAPTATAQVLKTVGVTHCALANNHMFDFGKTGMLDTLAALDDAGIGHTGCGKNEQDARQNLYLNKNGETVAVVAVCEHEYSYALPSRMGARGFDAFDTIEDIRLAKEKADRVIVLYHGGKEYCRYPSPRLRKVCHAMARAGADVVLCQHSHCIGCMETAEGCHIVYGQGNFHFSKNYSPATHHSPGWGKGMAAFYDTVTGELTFTFVENDGVGGIRLCDTTTADELRRGFEERSRMLTDGRWLTGWTDFCNENKDYYLGVVASMAEGDTLKQYNLLGHYLDCEAHHDVLSTLLPTANSTNELD